MLKVHIAITYNRALVSEREKYVLISFSCKNGCCYNLFKAERQRNMTKNSIV